MKQKDEFYKKFEIEPSDSVYISDSEKAYMNEIQKIPLLTAEEEKELGIRAFHGDLEAKNILAERNLRLVASIAAKHCGNGVSFLELIAEGNLHLLEIIEQFNPEKNYRFSTYAYKPLQRKMMDFISKQRLGIKICPSTKKQLGTYIETFQLLKEQLGRNPQLGEVAAQMGITTERALKLELLRVDPISFEEPVGVEKKQTVADIVPSTDSHVEALEDAEMKEKLIEYLKQKLSEQELALLYLMYGPVRHKDVEIARMFNVTHQAICESRRRILRKLRSFMGTKEFAIYMQNPSEAEREVEKANQKRYKPVSASEFNFGKFMGEFY